MSNARRDREELSDLARQLIDALRQTGYQDTADALDELIGRHVIGSHRPPAPYRAALLGLTAVQGAVRRRTKVRKLLDALMAKIRDPSGE